MTRSKKAKEPTRDELRWAPYSRSQNKSQDLESKRQTLRTIDDKMKALVAEASHWVGVREKGSNRGPEVEAFQKAVDGRAVGEPWCLAFVFYCIEAVDKAVDGPETWLFKTEHVMTCWNRTLMPARIQALDVRSGDLIIWQHFKNGKPTAMGHAGIVARVLSPGKFETIEGNTSDGRSVVREGDGVHRRVRGINDSGTMRVKGFLRPWGIRPAT